MMNVFMLSGLINYGFCVLEEPGLDGNEESPLLLVVEKPPPRIFSSLAQPRERANNML